MRLFQNCMGASEIIIMTRPCQTVLLVYSNRAKFNRKLLKWRQRGVLESNSWPLFKNLRYYGPLLIEPEQIILGQSLPFYLTPLDRDKRLFRTASWSKQETLTNGLEDLPPYFVHWVRLAKWSDSYTNKCLRQPNASTLRSRRVYETESNKCE